MVCRKDAIFLALSYSALLYSNIFLYLALITGTYEDLFCNCALILWPNVLDSDEAILVFAACFSRHMEAMVRTGLFYQRYIFVASLENVPLPLKVYDAFCRVMGPLAAVVVVCDVAAESLPAALFGKDQVTLWVDLVNGEGRCPSERLLSHRLH